jgi:metal-responsive CopG/Arc/MetJ family transcriptional regulator
VLSYVTMRAHVILDDELVDEVDALAGRRRRSAFIEDAVREKLQRERQRASTDAAAGSLSSFTPEWSEQESTAWVERSRDLDNKRLEQFLKRLSQK